MGAGGLVLEKVPPLTKWGEVAQAKRATEGRRRIPWENLQIAYNLINLPRSTSNSNDGSTTYYGYLSDGTKSLVTRQPWQRLVTRSTDEVCTAWVAIRQGCQIQGYRQYRRWVSLHGFSKMETAGRHNNPREPNDYNNYFSPYHKSLIRKWKKSLCTAKLDFPGHHVTAREVLQLQTFLHLSW